MSHRLLPQFCRFKSPFGGEQTAKVELEIVSRVKREGKVRQGGGSSSGGEEEAVGGERGQEERWKQKEAEADAEASRGREGLRWERWKRKGERYCSETMRERVFLQQESTEQLLWEAVVLAGAGWKRNPAHNPCRAGRAECSLRRGTEWEFSTGISSLAPSGERYRSSS